MSMLGRLVYWTEAVKAEAGKPDVFASVVRCGVVTGEDELAGIGGASVSVLMGTPADADCPDDDKGKAVVLMPATWRLER